MQKSPHPSPLPSEWEREQSAEDRFESWRKRAGFVLAPLAFVVVWFVSDVDPRGTRLSAILAAVAVLWVTEVLPLPVTALFGAVLCVVLGVAPAKQVLAYFADPIVFLFIGSFMLARAMMVHRLDCRIALGFLSIEWIAAHPARMLAGLGAVTALISMWVSNTATTAMMLPIALGVLGALHQVRVAGGRASGPMDARTWPFATGTMLMIAYAASIGGIGTPVGSPPNLIGVSLIRNATGVEISFFTWLALCVPLVVVMGAALFVLLHKLYPSRDDAAGAGSIDDYIERERAALGPMSRAEINTLIAFAVAVVLWMLPGALSLPPWREDARAATTWLNDRLPEATVALVAAVLLFILPVDLKSGQFTLSWDQAVRIDWGTILLFGGGLALGTLMFETGVAHAIGRALTSKLGVQSLWALTAVSIALGIILSEATSNTAAANMVIPVVIGIAQSANVSPIPPALGACLGASYGFMLPVSTPPNAIVYGSGLVSIPSMVRAGIIFDMIGFVIIWVGLRVLCPVLGLM